VGHQRVDSGAAVEAPDIRQQRRTIHGSAVRLEQALQDPALLFG
jgi:hypothetical protein